MLLSVSRIVVLCFFWTAICVANPRPGKTVSFNQDWQFQVGETTDDSKWRQLNLPHDWSIEGEFSEKAPAGTGGGALPGGIGWYRKTFTIDAALKGKLIFIQFDGVYRNSEVWINGHYLGKRPYGYSTFEYELTPHLVYGAKPNVIALKVDNSQQPNSRWYSGSGIYRNVWLTSLDPVHIEHWGTYVTTPEVSEQSATVAVKTKVSNRSNSTAPVDLTTIILDAAGRQISRVTEKRVVTKGQRSEVSQTLKVSAPVLWSDERPYLYKLISQLTQSGRVVDRGRV